LHAILENIGQIRVALQFELAEFCEDIREVRSSPACRPQAWASEDVMIAFRFFAAGQACRVLSIVVLMGNMSGRGLLDKMFHHGVALLSVC
jgi:hypothetical protein